MGLNIYCPKCDKPMKVRTSERPTPTTVKAMLFCNNCLNVRAQFLGGIERIEYATYSTVDPDPTPTEPKEKPKETINLGYFK
ncbi:MULTISPECIES: hypothetical protein [unclassified Lonepinella]|uniref:hypothetical protein n=1 Tax=unclassified Lonepinella TaxID=2642006 RepID=UPI0036D890F8